MKKSIKKSIFKINIISFKAFSIAEAMIVLLIGSLILGFSAPLITKQLKNTNLSSIQLGLLNGKINRLEEINADDRLDAIERELPNLQGTIDEIDDAVFALEEQTKAENDVATKVTQLEEKVKKLEQFQNFPSGSLVFTFGNCPNATYWADVTGSYQNVFIKAGTSNLGRVANASGYLPEHWHPVGIYTGAGNNDGLFISRGYTARYGYTHRNLEGDGGSTWTQWQGTGWKSYGMGTGNEVFYPNDDVNTAAKNSSYAPINVGVRVCRRR